MKQRELKRQPRAKSMLPAIKELITRRALENTDKDRTQLAHELIEEIQSRFPREIPPTEATLVKKISTIRTHQDISPIDKPWSMAVLNHLHELDIYDINGEAISAIMQVQHFVNNTFRESWQGKLKKAMMADRNNPEVDPSYVTDEMIEKTMSEYPILTIRQAKWVARLYKIQKVILDLYLMSIFYSDREIVSELSETPMDTDLLDQAIFDVEKFYKLNAEAKEKYGDAYGKAAIRSFRRIEVEE